MLLKWQAKKKKAVASQNLLANTVQGIERKIIQQVIQIYILHRLVYLAIIWWSDCFCINPQEQTVWNKIDNYIPKLKKI